jgi:hypothetical protein
LITENTEICSGSATILTASGSGTVSWYGDPAYSGIIGHGASYQTGIVETDTIFYVDAISDKGCKTNDSVMITVVASPSVVAMDDYYLCYGDEVTLRKYYVIN